MKLKEIRQCVMCGNKDKQPELLTNKNRMLERGEFIAKSTSPGKTCSRVCSAEYRRIENNTKTRVRYKKRMELLNH